MERLSFDTPAWHEPTPGFARRLVRGLVRDLAIIAALLLGLEIALRALPGARPYVTDGNLLAGHPRHLNRHGFRSEDYGDRIPAGRIPILFLGNSTTWGFGVAMESAYPNQLQAMLNAGTDGPYLAVNVSSLGGGCWGALNAARRRWDEVRPAIVVLGLSASLVAQGSGPRAATITADSVTRSPPRWSAARMHSLLHRSYAYGFLDFEVRLRMYRLGVIRDRVDRKGGALFAMAFADPGVDSAEVERAWADLSRCLTLFRDAVGERGGRLVMLSIPTRFLIGVDPADNERSYDLTKARIEPAARFAAMAAALNVPLVDPLPRFRRERAAMMAHQRVWDDLYTRYDYTHLDHEGMRLAAEELRSTLLRLAWIR